MGITTQVMSLFCIVVSFLFICKVVAIGKNTVFCPVKLVSDDSTLDEYFGSAVSISNNIIVVGAYTRSSTGSAYIFERNSITGIWNQTGKVRASDGESDDDFGHSVSISDGIVVIGAYDSSSAYIFEKDQVTDSWNQTAKLTANDGSSTDYFGYSVSISGNVVIVGAFGADGNDPDDSTGSAYIFEKDNATGTWYQTSKLVANDSESYDYFGRSVAISNNVAAISAYLDDDLGGNSGSVYVFKKNKLTGNWDQTGKLRAHDGYPYHYFGSSVSIENDIVVVGVHSDTHAGVNSGSAYIFEKDSSTLNWYQTAKLIANDATSNDFFGRSVSVSNNTVVVGAYGNDDGDNGIFSGSAYIFSKDSVTGYWNQTSKITATDGAIDDRFGYSVSISNNVFIVGAYLDDDAEWTDTGSAYIFNQDSNLIVNFENDDGLLPTDVLIELHWSVGTKEINLCDFDVYDTYDKRYDGIHLSVSDFCITVDLSACDETDLNSEHGYFTIYAGNALIAIGDYYDQISSNNICPVENHISFCVYNSKFCINNTQLDTRHTSVVVLKSYQSMVNCGFDSTYEQSLVQLECGGSYSCSNDKFEFVQSIFIPCYGAYACSNSYFNIKNGSIDCYGFGSCNSVTISNGNVNMYDYISCKFLSSQ